MTTETNAAAFRRRALLALDLTVAGDTDGAREAVRDLRTHHGPGHLTEALLVWVDALLGRTPPAYHEALQATPSHDHNGDSDPVTRWAQALITAVATGDKEAFVALRLAIPRHAARIEAHQMGLLTAIATHLRKAETRSS
ncbi:hypothetical protein [Streptosporangium sp. NPDC051022]|uniref:hypothetical protein n=1 Tax=Streptosporangium sp. NPDC051022 TaxID=3155752 RepID=UPI003431EC20